MKSVKQFHARIVPGRHGGVRTRTSLATLWSSESGRGLAALHNLAETRGVQEVRASVIECGQSSAAFPRNRWRAIISCANRSEPSYVGCYNNESGSAFIIVLWIAFGLVSLALYFGNSMVQELRAADNRVSGLGAEQAIEGAVRYVNGILGNYAAYGSNGFVPDRSGYLAEG